MEFFNKKIIIDLIVLIFLYFIVGIFFSKAFIKLKTKFVFLETINNSELKTIKNVVFMIIVFILYLNKFIFVNIFSEIYTLVEPKTINKIIYSIIAIYVAKIILILNELFNSYQKNNFKKSNTLINNYLKIFNFVSIITAIIFIISFWLDVKPITLITSLSAASAIFVLVFRDFILGVLSSITSANSNIARIGDYIKIEKYNIEGEIIDISINSVKLKDGENNILTFPTYMLTNEVMKNNWYMKEIKEKQIKFDFYLDFKHFDNLKTTEIENFISVQNNVSLNRDIILKTELLEHNIIKLNITFYIILGNLQENELIKLELNRKLINLLIKMDEKLLISYKNLTNQ